MSGHRLIVSMLSALVATFALAGLDTAALAQNEQFIPALVYRSGPYAPNGIPFANGFADYLALINERDGGINGVKIITEECETGYLTDRGIECYERLKNKGPTGAAAFSPLSTGITYALIERAPADHIPVVSMGYGRSDAADGRVFPWVFPILGTYWMQADTLIQYVALQEGGEDKLKGKKIALVYHESPYGKEPIPVFQALAKQYGFEFESYPVTPPGLEQKSIWLQIARQFRPDWTFMWGWGVMNSTAIKEAAAIGYPRDHFIGVWWSGAEPDVIPAGEGAVGYKAGAMHAAGSVAPVHQDIFKYLYDKSKGAAKREEVGQVLYNRGMINAALEVEAIRTAQGKFGKKPLTGEQVRWGLENLNIDDNRIKEIGFDGLISPLTLSCADHEGASKLRVQQWDGKNWHFVSDWLKPDEKLLRPMVEQSAETYAKEKNITPRDCSKAS
jgi:branched-chain amino acid transport system substrate-binding protein